MTANLAAALAIVAALEALHDVEPFITQLVDGSIVAIWMDDQGELHQDLVYRSHHH